MFGKRAGEYAAKFAKEHGNAGFDEAAANRAVQDALAPFSRTGEGAYQVQHELQDLMQDNVGIVRREEEMHIALAGIERFKDRAARVGVPGHREYNPGWHTALDLANLLTISEAIARAALDRKESRGGHFRDDYPQKEAAYASHNSIIKRGPNGAMVLERRPIPPLPAELQAVITEMG